MKLFFFPLITLSLGLSSCLKKQDLESPDVGAVVDQETITKAMNSDIDALSTNDLKIGEWSNIVLTRKYEDNPNQIDRKGSQLVFVSDKSQTAEGVDIELKIVDNNEDKHRIFNLNANSNLNSDGAPVVLAHLFAEMAIDGCKTDGTTCHNLKVENSRGILPKDYFDTSICDSPDACEVKIKKISFDRLITLNDGTRKKSNVSFLIIPKLPYLARVFEYCTRTVIKSTPRNFLVEDCLSVTGFKAGTSEPTP